MEGKKNNVFYLPITNYRQEQLAKEIEKKENETLYMPTPPFLKRLRMMVSRRKKSNRG